MIDVLADFVALLERQPDTTVSAIQEADGVVVARVTRGGLSASLVANAGVPPVSRTRTGAKQYGAYSIVEIRPDWIKGDDPAECVAYVVGWFDGLRGRDSQRRHAAADLRRLTDGALHRVDAAAVMGEIGNRAAWRRTGPSQMTLLDGRHRIRLEGHGSAIHVADGTASYSVTAGTVGTATAAVLGFTDGLSLEADD